MSSNCLVFTMPSDTISSIFRWLFELFFELDVWRLLLIDLATSIQPEKNIDIIFSLKDIINISSWSSNSIETFAPIFMTGIHYKTPKLLIGLEVGSRVEKKTIIFYHLGLEYKNRDGVVMRLGTSYKNMITAGIGFKTSYFNIDYAYLNPFSNTPFPASHIFSISISLNRINKIKGIIKP